MKVLQVCIFLLLVQVTIGNIDPEKDDTLKDRSYIVGLEMDDFPNRSATFVTENIFITCTPKGLSIRETNILDENLLKNVHITRYRFHSDNWNEEKLFETNEPLLSVVKRSLLIGKLPSNIVFGTDLIRPLSMFMPEGLYTKDNNYKFTYFIVSSNGSYTTPDFAFLVGVNEASKLFYLLGVKGKPSTSSLGSPVLARDGANKIGIVGIIVTLTYEGIFGMQAIDRKNYYYLHTVARQDIQMAADDDRITRFKEYIPQHTYMVPISFNDDYENIVFSIFVHHNFAITYYNGIGLKGLTVNFHFQDMKSASDPIELAEMLVFLKGDLLAMVIPLLFAELYAFVPVKRAHTKPPNPEEYTFYYFAVREIAGNIYVIGDSIDNGWTYDTEKLRADYMPAKQTEIGSAYVYKDANDDKPMLVAIIKSVDSDGLFRVLDLSTNDYAWLDYVILAITDIERYAGILNALPNDTYRPSPDAEKQIDSLVNLFGKLSLHVDQPYLTEYNRILPSMPDLLKQVRTADKDNLNIEVLQTLKENIGLLQFYLNLINK